MDHDVRRFVFIATCAVHDVILSDRPLDEAHPLWPKSHYGAHKAAIEKFVPADEIDQAMRAMLKPVVELLAEGGSAEDAMTRLEEIYPDLDATALGTMLARAMFVAKVWGRVTADAEHEAEG